MADRLKVPTPLHYEKLRTVSELGARRADLQSNVTKLVRDLAFLYGAVQVGVKVGSFVTRHRRQKKLRRTSVEHPPVPREEYPPR